MLIDWTQSMTRTYEFYEVDINTWQDKRKIDIITSCGIVRDSSLDTRGSAAFVSTERLNELYVRVYMICIQNGIRFKECLGTFLTQSPIKSFNGKYHIYDVDGYTSLIELKKSMPSIGYGVRKGTEILERAYRNIDEHTSAPVLRPTNTKYLYEHFLANVDDTWFSFDTDLLKYADSSLWVDSMGVISILPDTDIISVQPKWTFTDDNSSILLPEAKDDGDLYDVPNVVEVVYSSSKRTFFSRIVNDSRSSQTSTFNTHRENVYRETNPSVPNNMGESTSDEQAQEYLDNYAKTLLKKLSQLQHTVTIKHGYCPVTIGEGIMLDYAKAGMRNIKARVQSQSFTCDSKCEVETTAIYTIDYYMEDQNET